MLYQLDPYSECENTTMIIQGVRTTPIPPTYPHVLCKISLTRFIETYSEGNIIYIIILNFLYY